MTFEQFLMEKHAEDFIGTKDMLVDDFPDWLEEVNLNDLVEYADLFAKEQSKELLKACKEFKLWYLSLGNLNPDSLIILKEILPNEIVNKFQQAIVNAEGE